ncbi:MAG: flavodoxin family protein, partial [Deltaproteobacteria bacterium]|nr:flavodoxin family protein [Deltaproteobacteria bacterium]
PGFCAESADLLTDAGRHDLCCFFREFLWQVAEQRPMSASIPAIRWSAPTYDPPLPPAVARGGKGRIVVISDAGPDDHNLLRMIDRFERSVPLPVERLNLAELRMDGGCLGCMRCADDGLCNYRDDYASAFDQQVRPADVVIYAGAVRDRYLSARFKTFLDRYFCNGHRPLDRPQAMGFIISGPLGQLATLKQILEAHVQLFRSRRLGIVTDEDPNSEGITQRLEGLALAAERWTADPWFDPPTFLGVGGVKVFRDLVYDNRGLLSADHRYYRAHGLYDWPQTKRTGKWWFMTLALLIKRIPFLRRRADKLLLQGKMRSFHQMLQAQSGPKGA